MILLMGGPPAKAELPLVIRQALTRCCGMTRLINRIHFSLTLPESDDSPEQQRKGDKNSSNSIKESDRFCPPGVAAP